VATMPLNTALGVPAMYLLLVLTERLWAVA
jgi:hypothetical protein